MGGVLGFLSGGDAAASQAQGYANNAAQGSNAAYNKALQQQQAALTNSEGQLLGPNGSPSANTFIGDQVQGIQPGFNAIGSNLGGLETGLGIGSSRGPALNMSDLVSRQGASLAGVNAPLYKTGLAAYDNTVESGAAANASTLGAQAGGQSGIWGQGATAASTAYTDALDSFYKSVEGAGEAAGGAGSSSGGATGSGYAGTWDPSGTTAEGAIQQGGYF